MAARTKPPEPPPIVNIDQQAGNTKLLIAIIIVLSLAIAYVFLQSQRDQVAMVDNHSREMRVAQEEIHKAQEGGAIAYAQLRAQFNTAKEACTNNTQKYQAVKIWIKQHAASTPPADILTEEPCAAPEKKGE